MGKDQGASPPATGLVGLRPEPASGLGHSATVPSAGNSAPDWFEVAKGLANAIMFQRATRREHTVGRDGRVRMGVVDLLGCYAVDDCAREFCELAGLPFGETEAPNEHQAMFMAMTGRRWTDWFSDRDAIVEGAGPSPGKGKVDLDRLSLGIQATSAPSSTRCGLTQSPLANGVRAREDSE